MQPEDYYKTIFVSQPEISPNGNLVAFTRTVIKEEDNSRHREVWMQKLQNGLPDGEPFRFTDATVQSSNPRWSPDELYISRPDGSREVQLTSFNEEWMAERTLNPKHRIEPQPPIEP